MALFVRSSLFAAALLVASATAPARATETYQPEPKLLEAATKEGEVVLYTTHIVDQIVRPLIKAFQVHAPRVQVKYVRGDGLALGVRLTYEARAGRVRGAAWSMVDGREARRRAGIDSAFGVQS